MSTSQLNQSASYLKRVCEHVELKHLVQEAKLFRFEQKAEEHRLLRRLQRDLILKNASNEFKEDWSHIPHR